MESNGLATAYEPGEVESKWYDYWEENSLFKADTKSKRPVFSIVIPPPNVTGSLHMGHALNNTLQDVLCRYKRMKGYNVLWQPGTDHAGIATQNVVEKDLAQKGADRHQVGRERFIELVWEWREKYGRMIINQLKRLGSSCDWSRERFTMDEGLSRAVREVFVSLYEEGLIYRGDYIINWCPRCHTALADLEVEHEEMDSSLYYIHYPFEKQEGFLTVATTRPETLLGDTAVAVNPQDERFRDLSGLNVLLPILNKPIPVIYDKYVDMEFGTGALKITPAHDINDFEIGNTHDLERIRVIDDDGRMNDLAGPYQGMDRFECREKILDDLRDAGLLERVEPYRNAVGHCYRCKTMIEPLLSKQWFVKVGPLAEKAVEAVREARTRIVPSNWEAVYFEWMNNIRDWCVSRQIWWGHRIPAWYCRGCGEVIVAKEEPKTCPSCKSSDLEQETDVLDTWFSSALWPFSTLGWPDSTDELETYYPTSVLVTGFDILFFWVARMMMMGIHFMGDVPFRDVYIHALVKDEQGQKMSKSKGNIIDPLEVLDRFGTDAFRFTLAVLAIQGRDIRLSEERIAGYRNFINKIWNAARFVLMNVEDCEPPLIEKAELSLADRWIMTRLARVSQQVDACMDEYKFNEAASACYQFVWHEFCDWYLEMAKLELYSEDERRRRVSQSVIQILLSGVVRLLHPFVPFITEEIWQRLPHTKGSVMVAPFPHAGEYIDDEQAIEAMELVKGIITGIRNVRGEMNIPPKTYVKTIIDVGGEREKEIVEMNRGYIIALAKAESIEIVSRGEKPAGSATYVFGDIQVHVLLKGLIDYEKERNRIYKEIRKAERERELSQRKLANNNFLKQAPPNVVEDVREKSDLMIAKLEKLNQNLALIEELR
ncbi:MAG: valine--tRNA ligase [Deltaproteobacteria bacterium]|nr:valine--tRNA ligase [Deltaproteobacteria bacterium]MBW2078005.1 valine--tRNA ligase [Deltaproteobacteria bacterium]MBW2311503.1 valine--tRNA ligase [Deltaproteobacteria bacterium]